MMESPDEKCFIYLAEYYTYGDNNPCSKIGVSIDPEKRKQSLSAYCCGPVEIYKKWEVTRASAFRIEAAVKRKYKDYRLRPTKRELFTISPGEVSIFVEDHLSRREDS